MDPVAELGTPLREEHDSFCETLLGRVLHTPSTVVGLSCWLSTQYLGALWLAQEIRKAWPDCVIVVGGTHATVAAHDFLYPDSPFDLVVCGRAEATLLDIARLPRRPLAPTKVDGKSVPLDKIRFNWTYPYQLGSLYTSCGCPFHCHFCVERRDSYDCQSMEQAVDEIRRAAHATPDGFVHLQDACFGVHGSWRKEVLRGVCDLSLDARLDLETRADLLDEEDIELLGTARARILFGVESGSPQMLRWMGKSPHPERYLHRTREVLAACDRHGVEYMLSVLYNHPGETRTTLQESIEFFWRLLWDGPNSNLSSINVHRFAWYPGTPLDTMRDSLHDHHGTIIHEPAWWRSYAPDHLQRAEHVTASRDLPFEEATEMANRLRVAGFLCRTRSAPT